MYLKTYGVPFINYIKDLDLTDERSGWLVFVDNAVPTL